MISKEAYKQAVDNTLNYFTQANIVITDEEKQKIEVADFGLNDLQNVGLQILTYINTMRVCAKEMVLFPYQTCPQHRHIDSATASGKEETFRCRYGKVLLYVEGEGKKEDIIGKLPPTKVDVFTQVELSAGQQYTIYPNTWHWFQAGELGAVVSEFSTRSTDETDFFLDERIIR